MVTKEKNISQILALFVGTASFAMVLLWLLPTELTGRSSFLIKFNTCLTLFVSSVAIYLLNDSKLKSKFAIESLPLFTGVLVLLVGSVSGLQYLYQMGFGIDQFFIKDLFTAEGTAHPGRMAPTTCAAFVFLGVGIICIARKSSVENRLSYVTTLPLLLFSSVILIGYLYGQEGLYQIGPHIRMAPLTALNFFALSVALLFTKLTQSPFAVLMSKDLGGVTARRLGVPIVLIPLFLGGLWIEGLKQGYFQPKMGVTILVITIISLFLFLILYTSNKIGRLEKSNKAAQKAVDRIQKHFNGVIDNSNLIVWKTDLNLKINFFRGGIKKKLYENTENLIGSSLSELFPGSDKILAHSKRVLRGKEFTFEIKIGELDYSLILTPFRDPNGRLVGTMAVANEITEQKQAEKKLRAAKLEAEKANKTKSQFLANMSHEIRTPVGAIVGFSELLREEDVLQEDRDKYIGIIKRNSVHLQRLIDDILDLSKVEASMLLIDHSVFSLKELLVEIQSVMLPVAQAKGIEFIMLADKGLPANLKTDLVRLRQILINLCNNSIKFTDSGSVTLSVSSVDDRVEFEVSDTGVGISEKDAAKLFSPFSQGNSSTAKTFGGTGLGLALSLKLAEAMGGTLKLASSEVGKGSRFLATFNGVVASDNESILNEKAQSLDLSLEPSKSESVVTFRKTVLIVEDSEDNMELFKIFLKDCDISLSFAKNGLEAISRVKELKPDLVLMDIQMPVMKGDEATVQLRSDGFKGKIFALTANAMRDEKERCFSLGFDGYLTKPINRNLLIKTVNSTDYKDVSFATSLNT